MGQLCSSLVDQKDDQNNAQTDEPIKKKAVLDENAKERVSNLTSQTISQTQVTIHASHGHPSECVTRAAEVMVQKEEILSIQQSEI